MKAAARRDVMVAVPIPGPGDPRPPYTLFAQGSVADFPDGGEGFIRFKFHGGTAVALFYTFASFRRAYIVTGWRDGRDGEPVELPGVDGRLCLVLAASGRGVDRLKRCMYVLTREDRRRAFSLPLLFWYRLAALVRCGAVRRSDVMLLYRSFTDGSGNADRP